MQKSNNNNNSKFRFKRKKRSDGANRNSMGIPNPPPWSSTMTVDWVQRFNTNGAGVSIRPITNIDLQDLRCTATAAAVATRLFGAMKVRSIKIWAANSAATAANTIQVEWFTNNPYLGTSSKMYTDTAVGTSNVAYVNAKPPKGSFSADWLPNVVGTEYTIANITCPQGSVIDVHMTAQLIDDETLILVTGTVAGATAGVQYTRHLDSTNVSPQITPEGVIVI